MWPPFVRYRWARRLAFGLFVAQLALAGVAVGRWRVDAGSGSDPVGLLAAVPPAARPTGLENALGVAEPVARRWRDDAELVSATLQIDWPWEVVEGASAVAEGGWATIVFGSAGEEGAEGPGTLSVVVERVSGAPVRVEEVGWERAPAAAPLATYPISSIEAVEMAEEAGGEGFRRGCPESRHLTRVSLVVAPLGERTAPPVWLVTYHDTRQPERNALEVEVDAVRGRVVEVRDRSILCEGQALQRPDTFPRERIDDRDDGGDRMAVSVRPIGTIGDSSAPVDRRRG